MPPPIPTMRIVHVDEGSRMKKTYDFPIEPLIPPPSETFITTIGQKIISCTITLNAYVKDKGNGISL